MFSDCIVVGSNVRLISKTPVPLMIVEVTRQTEIDKNQHSHNLVKSSSSARIKFAERVLICNDGTRVNLNPKVENNEEFYHENDWDFEYNKTMIGTTVLAVFILYPKFL